MKESNQSIVGPCKEQTEKTKEIINNLTSKPIGKVFCGYKMTRSKQPRRVAVYAKLWAMIVN